MIVQRFRDRFAGDEFEAMHVDALDYDGMCDAISWCGGRAIGDEERVDSVKEAVIAIDFPSGAKSYAYPGDWIVHRHGTYFPLRPHVMAKFEQIDGAE